MPDPQLPDYFVPDKPDYRSMAVNAAKSAGLDPDFVGRIVDAESNGNPYAVSPKGAMGLMQVMPATAKQYGVLNLMDPEQNIKAGISYLKDLSTKYPNRPDLVAAAYNAGPGAVDKAGGVPPFKETQAYVSKVAGSPAASNASLPDYFVPDSPAPATKDKGQVIYSNSPQVGGGALATAAAAKAVPLAQGALEEFGTNPALPKLGSQIGRFIGGAAPTVAAALEGSPYGVLAGLASASRTAWAGGKTGWFTAKLAQDIARPVSRLVASVGPAASLALKASVIQQGLDLAQMAEPNRKDIGFLGIGTGTIDPKDPALINDIWHHLVALVSTASADKTPSEVSVSAPNGKTYTFPDQDSADTFKKRAGIK